MNIEEYWHSRREGFLSDARRAQGSQELLIQYRRLMEEMKTEALSHMPHEDVLRQQTALLFYEAMQGAELQLCAGRPVIVYQDNKNAQRRSILLRLLFHPAVVCGLLGVGLLFCFLSLPSRWICAVFFAAAIALMILKERFGTQSASAPSAVSPIQIETLDGFMTRQSRLLDQHISDLRLLYQDTVTPMADISLPPAALTLCQYVWASANAGYPSESALHAAEKLLRQNDAAWMDYSPEHRNWFDVMTTKKQSRMVFPALYRISDGALICRGQYIETKE